MAEETKGEGTEQKPKPAAAPSRRSGVSAA